MLVKRINKSKKAKIKQCCTTKLNSTNSLVPWQRRHKYFVHFPIRFLFLHSQQLYSREIKHQKAHRIVKYLKLIRMNPSIELRELVLDRVKFINKASLKETLKIDGLELN